MQLKHLILSAFLVSAASDSAVGADLTTGDVDRFIEAWPLMATEVAKADPEFDQAMAVALESQLQDMAASDSKDSKLDMIAAAHDYRDFESFAAVTARILTAAKWAKDPPDDADLKAALAAVEAQGEMGADAKATLSASIEQAFQKAIAGKPSDPDIETVRPHLAAIDAALANR